MNLHRARVTP